ncbi:MAG: two-component sensor histidine kinase [Agarilytica sp.]
MKYNVASIKFQILAAFSLLALPVVALTYFIFESHGTYNETIRASFVQQDVISLTSSLQRDVIDLQRNVLIYKSSASLSAVKRVELLNKTLNERIDQLRETDLNEVVIEPLESMAQHLRDYKNNFDVVVEYRQQRERLVASYVGQESDAMADLVREARALRGLSAGDLTLVLSARNNALSYLETSDSLYVDAFKKDVRSVRNDIVNLDISDKKEAEYIKAVNQYEKTFLRVVNLTRNYIYLINVVMAGSAREILYHSESLVDLTSQAAKNLQDKALKQLANRRTFMALLSGFGLMLAFFVPIYFFRLITQPIANITRVFHDLSYGKAVAEIPGKNRSDEIGLLARAADVFKAKNEQTHLLLVSAEKSVDIQQSLNLELSHAKTRAEKALSVKTDFLANMSHELRTPLNSVIGYTVRLLKTPEDYSERQLQALNTIERNGRHLLAMINDILDFSKIEAQKLEMNFQQEDLYQICADVIEQMKADSEEKHLQLVYEHSDSPLMIETDAVRLMQVLTNLVSNAIKYTESGSVTLGVEVDQVLDCVRLSVTDTGLGISEEDRVRLFKRFEQFDSNTKFKIGHGTGLGLAIVANVTRLLGATVTVKSELGTGSCFTVTLPFEQST